MSAFRFRAAAALEVRQKQEEAAQALYLQADAAWRGARARVESALNERRAAVETAAAAQQAGASAGDLDWHRNWIVRLAANADRLGRDAARFARIAREAEQSWQQARSKRLMLERLRERLWQQHRLAAGRRELKDIDELARLRHVARPSEPDTHEDEWSPP